MHKFVFADTRIFFSRIFEIAALIWLRFVFTPSPCDTPDITNVANKVQAIMMLQLSEIEVIMLLWGSEKKIIRRRETKRQNGPKKVYTSIDWIRITSIIKLIVQREKTPTFTYTNHGFDVEKSHLFLFGSSKLKVNEISAHIISAFFCFCSPVFSIRDPVCVFLATNNWHIK